MRSVETRVTYLSRLAALRDLLALAYDLVDNGARDHIRRDMIILIRYVYEVDQAGAVSRFNDIVGQSSQVPPNWE